LGIAQNVSKPKTNCCCSSTATDRFKIVMECVLDADDKCPDVAGLATLQRLPDRDGDGHY
jgi:hypothetical protein